MIDLRSFLETLISVDDETWAVVSGRFHEKSLARGRRLLQPGQRAGEYYFVRSGTLRVFWGQGEAERTGWLVPPGEFFGEIESLSTGQPTRFGIEALGEATVLVISRAGMDDLYRRYPVWQEFGRKLWQAACVRLIGAVLAYQSDSPADRYRSLEQDTRLLRSVPLKHIASFLGVTPSTLSRLRNKRN